MPLDATARLAAFAHVRRLTAQWGTIPAAAINEGFILHGERLSLWNPRRGIYKPAGMDGLLSITTRIPRAGTKVWYDDQREVHKQIERSSESIEYAFMGTDPGHADNRALRNAMERHLPIIYFLGAAPSLYEAHVGAFIIECDPRALRASIAFGDADRPLPSLPENPQERRYGLRTVRQRLHQASFRLAVIDAYGDRCALSGLPEPLLLDAAHIMPDADERLGQPVVPNGIALSKVHHAAFDAHLLGIDPDLRIHVARRLLNQRDGPLLASIQQLAGNVVRKPSRARFALDRDRLAQRFETFRQLD